MATSRFLATVPRELGCSTCRLNHLLQARRRRIAAFTGPDGLLRSNVGRRFRQVLVQMRAGMAGSADLTQVSREVHSLINVTVENNPDTFASYKECGKMDVTAFQKLISIIVPTMGKEETQALFVSMNTTMDGRLHPAQIFSDTTMSILHNRMGEACGHPLEGSYRSLPSSLFHQDRAQLKALDVLKVVFDEVVEAHDRPSPEIQPAPKKECEPLGGFATAFGGVRRTKPPRRASAIQAALVTDTPAPSPNAPKGAYLCGGGGRGKTLLLDLFFRSLPDGFTARRLHWHEFIRDAFRAMQRQPPGDNIFQAMAEMLCKQFRVLLLDELLITHISEAILVKNLFRQMWARGMTIIVTSNYLPEDLYSKGFSREQFLDFIPDLEKQCQVVNLGNTTDYRKIGAGVQSACFFHPIDATSSACLDNAFSDLVGKDFECNVPMPVLARRRNITVPVSGRDPRNARVARFSFEDLCMDACHRADLTTIAERFHIVFLDKVPKFKPELAVEFRRFANLVDIFYAKKVILFMQSEVDVSSIFADVVLSPELETDELWSFRRCSGMLLEMQDAKYHHMVWLMRNHMLQDSSLHLLDLAAGR